MAAQLQPNATELAERFLQARRTGERLSIDLVIDNAHIHDHRAQTRAEVLRILDRRLRDRIKSGVAHDGATSSGITGDSLLAPPDIPGYEIIDCVGRGGMGVVWEAYQCSTGRRVAVKFLNESASSTRAARQRFEREVELLARLQHPRIVSIVDSGISSGRYYYAMDYVDGRSLDEYFVPGDSDPRRVMAMMILIADTVDFAHQRGVLHRDLKPSNILVDQSGDVRVLDFGLAKALDPEADAGRDSSLSEPGQLLGTLGYMPPEQSRGQLHEVSVRSDVYSLGAVAYELLTGHLPVPIDGALADVLSRILIQDPATPSSFRTGLSKDVDAILLKALDKNPARRYSTAGDFAAELRRYLAGEPVEAQPQTFVYRAGKFAKRNKLPVAFAGILILGSIGFGIVTTIQSAKIARERDRAQAEAGKAREINSFLNDMLASINPSTGIYRTKDQPTLRAMLDTASRKVDRELTGQPEVEASVRDTLGRVYLSLGLYESAESHLQKALTLRTGLFGTRHPDVAASLAGLGALRLKQTRFTEAEPLMAQSLDIRRAMLGDDHELIVTSEINLSEALHSNGHYVEAEAAAQRAVDRGRRIFKGDHAEIARGLHALGFSRWGRGDQQRVEECYRESLAMRRRLFGDEHPSIAMSLNNLGALIESPSRFAEAEAMYREALDISEKVLGSEHPQVILLLNNLANIKRNQKEYEAALPLAERAIALAKEHLDPAHYIIALSLGNLAKINADQGKYEAAEPLFRESLAVAAKAYPPTHPQVGVRTSNLGDCLAKLARFEEAELLVLKGHSILEAKFGPTNSRTQDLIAPIIACYEAWHRAQPERGHDVKAGEWRGKLNSPAAKVDP